MDSPDFNTSQLWSIVGSTVRNVSAVIIGMGIIWGASWYALQPRIDDYFESFFDAKFTEISTELRAITLQLQSIRDIMPDFKRFLDMRGSPQLVAQHSYRPGSTLTLLYLVRTNLDCPAIVRAQFFAADINAVATEYSYDVPAQVPARSFDYQLFVARVHLPETMQPGFYSYAPIVLPDRVACPAERNIQVAPSPFFEVAP